jgi:glycosyltransferase involved in cell wall biosynthesis
MKRPIIFVILQTGARANGGLQSVTEVMLRLKDHFPLILTNLETEVTRAWRAHGIDSHVVSEEASGGLARNPLRTIRTYARFHRALARLLGSSDARVIHANDPLAFQLSLTAAKLADARLALNLRDTLDPGRKPPRLKFWMLFGAADHVFYLSEEMAEHWRQVAGNAMRACSISYSIVDPERFAPSLPSVDHQPVVLIPGIFWRKKRQLEFIQNVVPALAQRGIKSWFVGDFEPETNRYAAACATAARPFGDQVRFLGFRSDLPQVIRDSSVVAIPSRHEGLVRGMIEAMSCGRPVVSFDVCSAREILEEKSSGAGAVLQSGDYAGMAESLIRYATDREAQVTAGRAGSALARQLFNADTVAERYERVYRELAKEH